MNILVRRKRRRVQCSPVQWRDEVTGGCAGPHQVWSEQRRSDLARRWDGCNGCWRILSLASLPFPPPSSPLPSPHLTLPHFISPPVVPTSPCFKIFPPATTFSPHLPSSPLLCLESQAGSGPPQPLVLGRYRHWEVFDPDVCVSGKMIIGLHVQEDYIITRSKQFQFCGVDNNRLVYFYIFLFIIVQKPTISSLWCCWCHIESILLMSLPLPLSYFLLYICSGLYIVYMATQTWLPCESCSALTDCLLFIFLSNWK